MSVQHRLKRDNILRILKSLWRNPGQSRAELARDLRLDRSTVGSLADWMIKSEMIEEGTSMVSSPKGGRPAVRLKIKEGYAYAIGVELTVPQTKFYAADMEGRFLDGRTVHIRTYGPGAVDSLAVELARFRNSIEERYPMKKGLATVGLGVSGAVDNEQKEIRVSNALKIDRPLSVSEPLKAVLNAPIVLFNDAQACALGEANRLKKRDLILVLIEKRTTLPPMDIGVGIGIIHNDQIMQGRPITHLLQPKGLGEDEENKLFMNNLGRSLALIANVTGSHDIILGGDADEYREELRRLIIEYTTSNKENSLYSQILQVKDCSNPEWAVASGALHSAVREILQNRTFSF